MTSENKEQEKNEEKKDRRLRAFGGVALALLAVFVICSAVAYALNPRDTMQAFLADGKASRLMLSHSLSAVERRGLRGIKDGKIFDDFAFGFTAEAKLSSKEANPFLEYLNSVKLSGEAYKDGSLLETELSVSDAQGEVLRLSLLADIYSQLLLGDKRYIPSSGAYVYTEKDIVKLEGGFSVLPAGDSVEEPRVFNGGPIPGLHNLPMMPSFPESGIKISDDRYLELLFKLPAVSESWLSLSDRKVLPGDFEQALELAGESINTKRLSLLLLRDLKSLTDTLYEGGAFKGIKDNAVLSVGESRAVGDELNFKLDGALLKKSVNGAFDAIITDEEAGKLFDDAAEALRASDKALYERLRLSGVDFTAAGINGKLMSAKRDFNRDFEPEDIKSVSLKLIVDRKNNIKGISIEVEAKEAEDSLSLELIAPGEKGGGFVLNLKKGAEDISLSLKGTKLSIVSEKDGLKAEINCSLKKLEHKKSLKPSEKDIVNLLSRSPEDMKRTYKLSCKAASYFSSVLEKREPLLKELSSLLAEALSDTEK